jgi:preprotein translocase subunit SecD
MTKESRRGGLMKNLLIATVLLTGLSGSALLRSEVAVSHQLPKDLSGTTYVMIPFKDQEGSLEHKAYEEAVRQELNAKGFRETTVEQAETVVFLAYGIETVRRVISSYPIIGQTGVEDSSPWPTYGFVGKGETSQTEYRRVLRLDIVDKEDFAEGNIKKVYEGRVVSSGFSDKLDKVLPKMVKALFEDFPGQSGSTKTLFQPTDSAAVFGDFL